MNPEFLRRLAAEFAIIFVGVVLAFQFENWRESRQDRERETESLQALAQDFETNREILRITTASQEETMDAMGLWLGATSGAGAGVPLDSLGSVFPVAISWYGEEIVSGAFDALIGSGDIGLVRDAALRRRLADFYGIVESGFEDHDDEMNTLALIVDLTKVQLGPLLAPTGVVSTRRADTDTLVVRDLLATPGLHGLLAWKSVLSRNRIARLRWLAAHADTIAGMLPPPAEPVSASGS